jgi:hypothetical protein
MPRRLVHMNHRLKRCQIVETEGVQTRYIALSLCWGDSASSSAQARSTTGVLQNEIAMTQMPQNIVEAANVCATLGVAYLWVDSLCTVMGNDEETMLDVYSMAEIYQNALVTITLLSPQEHAQSRDHITWGRFEILCPGQAVVDRLRTLKEHVAEAGDLCDFTLTLDPEVYVDVKSILAKSSTSSTNNEPAPTVHEAKPLSAVDIGSADEPEAPLPDSAPDEEQQGPTPGKPQLPDTQASDAANLHINEGLNHYRSKDRFQAVASFVQARDCITVATDSSDRASQAFVEASVYLAIVFLRGGSTSAALDVLHAAEAFKKGLNLSGNSPSTL